MTGEPLDEYPTPVAGDDPATLVEEAYRWLIDASVVVHTVGEPAVVPRGPHPDEMWELGKVCADRLGLVVRLNRLARRHGVSAEDRLARPDRHFLCSGLRLASWEEAIVAEALSGVFWRLFFESFMNSAEVEIDGVVRELWTASQQFIRYGQARLAQLVGGDGAPAVEAAVDRWLPVALAWADEVPPALDAAWLAARLRTRSNDEVRGDLHEELAMALQANDLPVPAACAGLLGAPEVRWVDLTERADPAGQSLRPATFAFSDRTTGRPTAAGPTAAGPTAAGPDADGSPTIGPPGGR